jgi:RNA polymerase sigma factor (TIGR02999 family)
VVHVPEDVLVHLRNELSGVDAPRRRKIAWKPIARFDAISTATAMNPVTTEAAGNPSGNAEGVDEVFKQVYARLKVMARRELSRSSTNTLNTTALVHELYLKMCSGRDLRFENSVKFFSYAAMGMRHILVDRATRRGRIKFGGADTHVELDGSGANDVSVDAQLALQLDAALRELEQDDMRAARVVELHYFAGLPLDHVGDLLGVARRTVDRDWRYARAFLESRMD